MMRHYLPAAFFAISVSFVQTQSLASPWTDVNAATRRSTPLCRALVHRLNSVQNKCTPVALYSFPEFTELSWEPIDAAAHEELLAELMLLSSSHPSKIRITPFSAIQVSKMRKFVSAKIKTHHLVAEIFHGYITTPESNDGKYPVPPGEHTFLRIIDPQENKDLSQCVNNSEKIAYNQSAYLVLSDLSAPDLQVDDGYAFLLQTTHLMNYKNNLIFVGQDETSPVSIIQDSPDLICNFSRN